MLADPDVSVKVIKCRENQSESGSENVCMNGDQLGVYTYR